MLGKQCFCNLGKILTSKSRYVAELSLEGVLGGTLAPPEFGVSEERTEMDSLLLPAPPDLKT